MRRLALAGLLAVLAAGPVLVGCSRQQPPSVVVSVNSNNGGGQPAAALVARTAVPPAPQGRTPPAAPAGTTAEPPEVTPVTPPEPAPQAKYDTALLDALNCLADHKYADALASLEVARAAQDTDQVRLEIEIVKTLQEQQAAAEQTAQGIRTVLTEGKVDEAAELATAALRNYGPTDAAAELAKLKREADALRAAGQNDNVARQDHFRDEGEAALKDQNLRAAAIAFEQAVACGDDAALRRRLDDLHATLARYDDGRARAAELRRDPGSLDDALAALQDAQKAWDTLQVRQEIDEYTLALEKRRDRLSIADFEVRGDTGIPDAGRTVAEELLPAFKGRYDLVERGQLGKVVEELKLQASDLAESDGGRREVGRLAKVRYLVLGSVTRTSGLTVNARLVDVHTGLVVQTAKVVAPTPDDLVPLLPQLANVLLMTDEQKIAYEQQAQQAQAAVTAAVPAELPPAPEPVADQPPPPPLVVSTPCPPPPGGIRPEDFDRLPPPPLPGQPLPPPPVVAIEQAQPVRNRLLQVSIEVGDNLFRRGCYPEAQRHFELALSLCPDRPEVRLRVERCRPYLPPPPPAVVVEQLPSLPPPRPRLAVLNFVECGDAVPPGLGGWTADNLAPYLCPPYEIVDGGEVFWYMARLGMTMHDLMADASARLWLARALRVRYFLLGTLRAGDGLAVATHLVDAEHGCEVGGARIAVHDPYELRLRLCELARLTVMAPEERLRCERQLQGSQDLLVQAQVSFGRGDFEVSVGFFEQLLKSRPDDVRVQVLYRRCRQQGRQVEQEKARRREWQRQQAVIAQLQRRQWELAQATEAARLRAEHEAAALGEADRRLRQQQAELAYAQLMLQAQTASRQQDFQVSIQFYESALALHRSDDGFRELAVARARAEESARTRCAGEQARREAEVRRQRDAEVAQLRAQVEEERRRREAEQAPRVRAQQERDQTEYAGLLAEGQRMIAEEKYDRAVLALQGARQVRRSDEEERLLNQALEQQARAAAARRGERARAELERQLTEEKARRAQTEALARHNQELYAQALQLARQAQAEKRYEVAIAKYHEAEKVCATDVVLTGLRQAEAARAAEAARVDAEQRKHVEEQRRAAQVLLRITEGQKALEAGQYDRAVEAYRAADRLSPGNVDALAGLSKAEAARDDAAAAARRRQEAGDRQANFRTLVAAGKSNLAAKQYDAAVLSLGEAVKLNPADAEARAALDQAQKARDAALKGAQAWAEAQKRAEAYQKRLSEGRLALAAKQYDTAMQAFRDAQQIVPGDQASAAFLKEAEQAKRAAAAAAAGDVRKRDEERQRAAALQQALADGRSALAAHNVEAAARSIGIAARTAPQDPDVLRAQQELQKAQQGARAEVEAHHRLLDSYHAQMKVGRDALNARRYDDAIKAFAEADRMLPEDDTARQLIQEAEKARAEARAAVKPVGPAPDVARQREEEQRRQAAMAAEAEKAKRQAAYQQAMQSGRAALAAKRYDDAAKTFAEAGRLQPGDGEAAALLREAQHGQTEARMVQDAEARRQQDEQRRRAEYAHLMAQGQAALAAKRHDEAVKAFSDALKEQPGDADATRWLSAATQARDAARTPPKSPPQRPEPAPRPQPPVPAHPATPSAARPSSPSGEYAQHMAEGQKLLAARHFAEAAREFDAALKLSPGSAEASAALKRAREGRP